MKTIINKFFNVFIFIATFDVCSYGQTSNPLKLPLFFEKVFIHTDRDYYASGDDIWFKAYLLNGISNKCTESSKNLYIQLFSEGEKPELIASEVISIDSGIGHGDFHLKDSLLSGTYHLRAYTNWMLNFGENFFFDKKIYISGMPNASLVSADDNFKKDEIKFYPEGGSLVNGILSNVAFKAVDASGKGILASGVVLTSAGDTASVFNSEYLGMGSFSITPQKGLSYYATGYFRNNIPFSVKLPDALDDGLALQVDVQDTSTVLVSITSSDLFFKENKNQTLVFKVLNHSKMVLGYKIQLVKRQIIMHLPGSDFPSGVSDLILYDSNNRPQCERLIFEPCEENQVVNVSSNRKIFAPRDSVHVSLKLPGNNVSGNLSLSAIDYNTVPEGVSNIVSYLELESELKGEIENPAGYFDTLNAYRSYQLDLLLLTQGWRNFLWRQMRDSSYIIRYAPEAGFSISGRVRKLFEDKPVVGNTISLYMPDAQKNKVLSTYTDKNGKYYFDGLQFNETCSLVLKSLNKKGEKADWIFMDSINKIPAFHLYPHLKPDTTFEKTALQFESIKKHKVKYSLKDTIVLDEFVITAAKIKKEKQNKQHVINSNGGIIDYDYTLDKDDQSLPDIGRYLQGKFPNIELIILPGVGERIFFRAKGEISTYIKPIFSMDGNLYRGPLAEGTIYLQPVEGIDRVLISYNFNDIPKVNEIAKLAEGGNYEYDENNSNDVSGDDGELRGIYYISIYTKPLPPKKEYGRIDCKVEGYYNAREFYLPGNKNAGNIKEPDLRSTLYWKPNVEVTSGKPTEVSFYNDDIPRKVKIIVQGITSDGKPVYGITTYEVKN